MRKIIRFQNQCLKVLFVLMVSLPNSIFSSDNITHIKQAIAAKGANWTAGESWVTQLSLEELKQLCSAMLPIINPNTAKLLSLPKLVNPPPVFDWRNNNGNWMTPVKNQGFLTPWMNRACGSCWDFAAVAAVEAWWKIHHARPDSQIDLSEQFVLSCSEGSCDGWWADGALEFIRIIGVPTEGCFPYQADDTIPCDSACADWEQEAVTIPGWGYITLEEANVNNIKIALSRKPVVAWFWVYEDFLYYKGGVYEHVWGNFLGGHYIVLVGWNDYEQSWICKNSWASSWGDKGYFRIKWGECEIGTYCLYIWDNQTGSPALATTPNKFDLSIVAGDSLVESLMVQNLGAEPLEYSTLVVNCTPYFHPDSFMSFDSLSWWCGDPQIEGYQDNWFQYLETPVLDLSATSQPQLSCQGYWHVMDNLVIANQKLFDGWEGCNVWVSSDGGKTFIVAEPISPKYNSHNLYSFSFWYGFSQSIPGWIRSSNGWQNIELDLSSYKSDNVVVRFAFASIPPGIIINKPLLPGFFVDDIVISDGGTILFEDHGDDASNMTVYGESNFLVDWMEVNGASGSLSIGESEAVQLLIDTRALEPGKYYGGLTLFSNDTTVLRITVPVNLEVTHPDHDLQVQQVWPATEELPILVPLRPKVKIRNRGLNEEISFNVICQGLFAGHTIYRDTCLVTSLLSKFETIIQFKPLVFSQTGDANFIISLCDVLQDHNLYNNSISISARIGYLVDSFESETELWDCEPGWSIEASVAHTGQRVARTVSKPSQNCCLTFKPGFDLSSVDKATLKFWTRHVTEKNRDVCYVEASHDSLTWTRLDSLSGSQYPQWAQSQVSLAQFTCTENEHVWVRFHFISDSVNTYLGVFIDDVEIYPENPTVVWQKSSDSSLPTFWRLEQNYPNPFNPSTTIEFALPKSAFVTLKIYNLRGEEVASLVAEKRMAGIHRINWDARGLASGVYLYRLEARNPSTNSGQVFVQVKKLILMR